MATMDELNMTEDRRAALLNEMRMHDFVEAEAQHGGWGGRGHGTR